MIPQALIGKTATYIGRLLERGIIRDSESVWRNPIRALAKPNGDIRLVSNLMALNDLVEKDPHDLESIREVVRAVEGASIFTVVDLKDAFYHTEIEETDKHKTASEFEGLVYEWNAIFIGFENACRLCKE